jgi:hypothetical protein
MHLSELAHELRSRPAHSLPPCNATGSADFGRLAHLADVALVHGWCRCTCGELHVAPERIGELVADAKDAAAFLRRLDRIDAAAHQ